MSLVGTRPTRRLTQKGSYRFLTSVRANFSEASRPAAELSRVLGCSLNTARKMLRPTTMFLIRDIYAVRLAGYLGVTKRHVTREPLEISDDCLSAWSKAKDPLDNRTAAKKLGFGVERIVMHSFKFPCDLEFNSHANHSMFLVILTMRPYPDPNLTHTLTFHLRDGRTEFIHQLPDGKLSTTMHATLKNVRTILKTIKAYSEDAALKSK